MTLKTFMHSKPLPCELTSVMELMMQIKKKITIQRFEAMTLKTFMHSKPLPCEFTSVMELMMQILKKIKICTS